MNNRILVDEYQRLTALSFQFGRNALQHLVPPETIKQEWLESSRSSNQPHHEFGVDFGHFPDLGLDGFQRQTPAFFG